MIVHAPEGETKPARPGDCGCGCGGKCGCESRCCDLECLVRPNFFCGQVLTDTDLSAIVEWSRARFALTRYRHGWGVVCGLDVTCSHPRGGDDCCSDSHKGPKVWINPGYAIDCCGNDLVVCEPMAVDLSDVCLPLDDPCAPPTKPKPDPGQKKEKPPNKQEDCFASLGDGLFAVSLTLRYHEDLAQGQRAMFRSGCCSDVGSCEHTRVLERPCVHAEVSVLDSDNDDEYEDWDREFTIRRARVQRDIATAIKLGPEAVLKYLRRHPPYKFCFLEELVCCELLQVDPAGKKGDLLTRVGVYLFVDWLLHELECPCWSCRPDGGVPVARVLLKRVEVQGEQMCRVLLIDSSVPYRRPLRKDHCRPIPRGAIDLAPYLWQPGRYVRERLGALGVNVKEVAVKSELELLRTFDQAALFLDMDASREVQAWVMKDPFDRERVAGFSTVANP